MTHERVVIDTNVLISSLFLAPSTPAQAVDKAVTDQAPWVSMFNPKLLDFTSSRVKGFQFSPQWYFLLAQASVK